MKKLLLIALTIAPLVLHALPKIPDELANYRGQCNSEQAQALVGKSHFRERQFFIGSVVHFIRKTICSAY